jgi:hypothetical protein
MPTPTTHHLLLCRNAASALLPFTCNILACDSDELHVRLHNKICEVVAQVCAGRVKAESPGLPFLI